MNIMNGVRIHGKYEMNGWVIIDIITPKKIDAKHSSLENRYK